jgi:hypothetical protein
VRSTHGICDGALSWAIESGEVDGIDLAGLGVVLATRYSDDEDGSPWTFRIFVDDRADTAQGDALGKIFTGALGGTVLDHFPWAWKASNPLAIERAGIEIDHTPGRGWFRAGESAPNRWRSTTRASALTSRRSTTRARSVRLQPRRRRPGPAAGRAQAVAGRRAFRFYRHFRADR